MLFNSFEFIFIFLPIVWIGYFLISKTNNKRLPILWLIISSLFFYSYWNPKYIFLILISMFFNYICGSFINRFFAPLTKKSFLIIGILGNVALLGYYKYADFFINNINGILKTDIALLHLMLPLGISFFTFQQIAYLVDTFRGETKEYNIITYMLFVTFFPQLIAGPIVHHKEVIPQFESKQNKKINYENLSKGLYIFFIGLAKKVAIADTLSIWANDGFQNYQILTFPQAWITSISYTLQLYFDFSGYCDMAIGLALLFNIKIPINFYSPYKARNIQEFWRTWHITLSRFLTQYIYIPLGGNRKGNLRTYVNIFIVFFVSGFWHGAGWNFILWGVLHGVASIICRLFGKLKVTLPYIVSWFITFLFVNASWVYFRATSIAQANTILKKMFSPNFNSIKELFLHPLPFANAKTFNFEIFSLDNPKIAVLFIILILLASFLAKNSIQLLKQFRPNWLTAVWVQLSILFVLITIFFLQKNSVFLYFNF